MKNFKPDTYNSVSPYLIVSDAEGTLRFLEATFDAAVLLRVPGEEGRLRHSEARIDDTVVMIADSMPGWPPMPAHVHVYVADVDATYRRALKAGATSVQEPLKKDDADKRGGVKDVGGTTWWIATKVG